MKLLTPLFLIFAIIFFNTCNNKELNYLIDPRSDGATKVWTGEWFIYNDQLNTGGGVILQPGEENQTINLEHEDLGQPERHHIILYTWNGQNVCGQHLWSGVSFSTSSDSRTYNITPSKDLSPGGYKKVTFWAKVILSENTLVRFEGPVPSLGVQQNKSCNWKFFSISIEPHMLKNVKDYFVISFQYTGNNSEVPGGGGIVYLDEICYKK